MSRYFICHQVRDLALINRRDEVTILTNNPDVFDTAQQSNLRVGYLDLNLSLPALWPETRALIDEINHWLVEFTQLPTAVVDMTPWVEADNPARHIFDALLISKSLDAREQANASLLEIAPGDSVTNELAVDWASQRGISVRRVGGWFRHFLAQHHFEKRVVSQVGVSLPPWLANLLRRVRLRRRLSAADQPARLAGNFLILMDSRLQKHFENARPLIEAFSARGYKPVVVSWNSPESGRFFSDMGNHQPLESFLTSAKWRDVQKKYESLRRKFRREDCRDSLLAIDQQIGSTLYRLVEDFFEFGLLQRLTQFACLEQLAGQGQIDICRTWGFGLFPLGAMLHEAVEQSRFQHPVYFQNLIGTDIYPCQSKLTPACDLVFVSGPHEKTLSAEAGIDGPHLVVGGFTRMGDIVNFQHHHDRASSLQALGLQEQNSQGLTVFFASSGITRGYVGVAEHYQVLKWLEVLATKHSWLRILVKPHPSDPDANWLGQSSRPENMILIDKSTLPYHCVNLADVVLLKFSTLAFESMVMQKPVISVSLDGDERSQATFGGSVELFNDLALLEAFICELSDETRYAAWRKAALARQNTFLPQKFHVSGQEPAEVIADKVLAELPRKRGTVY